MRKKFARYFSEIFLKLFESLYLSVSIHTGIIFLDNIAPENITSKDQTF